MKHSFWKAFVRVKTQSPNRREVRCEILQSLSGNENVCIKSDWKEKIANAIINTQICLKNWVITRWLKVEKIYLSPRLYLLHTGLKDQGQISVKLQISTYSKSKRDKYIYLVECKNLSTREKLRGKLSKSIVRKLFAS